MVTDILATCNSENDNCIIKSAGIGISFCSSNDLIDSAADFVGKKPSFHSVLEILN